MAANGIPRAPLLRFESPVFKFVQVHTSSCLAQLQGVCQVYSCVASDFCLHMSDESSEKLVRCREIIERCNTNFVLSRERSEN